MPSALIERPIGVHFWALWLATTYSIHLTINKFARLLNWVPGSNRLNKAGYGMFMSYVYQYLAWLAKKGVSKATQFECMNYGVLVPKESPDYLQLPPEMEDERKQYNLYRLTATGNNHVKVKGLTALEVGCGRGGGASFVARFLEPESMTGVDLSAQAIQLARSRYGHIKNLTFKEGNATSLPLPENHFDLVINVESSHCYPSFKEFVDEVHRVLKPGGHFCITDLRKVGPTGRLDEMLDVLKHHGGLKIVHELDITSMVLASCDTGLHASQEVCSHLPPRWAKPMYNQWARSLQNHMPSEFRSRQHVYLLFVLQKYVSLPAQTSKDE